MIPISRSVQIEEIDPVLYCIIQADYHSNWTDGRPNKLIDFNLGIRQISTSVYGLYLLA